MATTTKSKKAVTPIVEYPRWDLAQIRGAHTSYASLPSAAYSMAATPGAGASPPPIVIRAAKEEPEQIVQKYVIWAGVGGFLPFAVLDIAFLTVVNYYLIKELSEYYDVTMDKKKLWDLSSALFAGLIPQSFKAGVPGALIRMIPIVGPFLNGFTQAAFAGGVTYLLGHIAIANLKATGSRTDPQALMDEVNDAVYRYAEYLQNQSEEEAAA